MSSTIVKLANERRASLRSSVRKLTVPNGLNPPNMSLRATNIQQTPITSHPVNKEEKLTRKCNRKIMPAEPAEQVFDAAENVSALNQTYTIKTGEKADTIVRISQPKVVIERNLEIEEDPSHNKLTKKIDSSCSGSTFDGRWLNVEAWNRSIWNEAKTKHHLESNTDRKNKTRRSPERQRKLNEDLFETLNQSGKATSRNRMQLNEIAANNIGGNRSINPDSLALHDPINTILISESIKENTPELNKRTYLRTPGSKQEMITKSIVQFTPENIKDSNVLPENLDKLHVNNLQPSIKFAVPKQTIKTKKTRKCQSEKSSKIAKTDRRSNKLLEGKYIILDTVSYAVWAQ